VVNGAVFRGLTSFARGPSQHVPLAASPTDHNLRLWRSVVVLVVGTWLFSSRRDKNRLQYNTPSTAAVG